MGTLHASSSLLSTDSPSSVTNALIVVLLSTLLMMVRSLPPSRIMEQPSAHSSLPSASLSASMAAASAPSLRWASQFSASRPWERLQSDELSDIGSSFLRAHLDWSIYPFNQVIFIDFSLKI